MQHVKGSVLGGGGHEEAGVLWEMALFWATKVGMYS
jgi:hypothetical protein